MAYRDPAPPPVSQESAELAAYEAQLRRSARRKKIVFGLVVGGMGVLGFGSCLGPVAVTVASEVWNGRKTKLTAAEAKEVKDRLDPLEADAKKSQAAFDALWPKLRAGEIGARRDLGACLADVPGPNIEHEDSSTSLQNSSEGEGWTFVDVSPSAAKSPLEGLKMPQGSMALNNTGTGDRFVFAGRPLRTASGAKAPTLDSTTTGLQVASWRAEAAEPIRHDAHASFLDRVKSFAGDGLPLDVVVFVDLWEDPKFSDAPAPTPKDDLEALEKGSLPTRMFEGGLAIARAFAWDPQQQKIVCASQALAESSEDIRIRSDDIAPLRQDLVLQLEKSLVRSFVAVGDAPPRIARPAPRDEQADAGAPALRRAPKPHGRR